MAQQRIPLNKNNFSPNKFKVTMSRFPTIEYTAQSANIPGISMGTPQIPTNKWLDYYVIGDKLIYNDLNIGFMLDENLKSFRELRDWLYAVMSTKEVISIPRADIDILLLTNNSNQNLILRISGAFPYMMSDVNMSYQMDENFPVTVDVTFKFVEYEIIQTRT